MYQPVVARFMSRDPLPADGSMLLHPMPNMVPAFSSDAHSTYAYVSNSPLRYIDPSGMVEEVVGCPGRPALPQLVCYASSILIRAMPCKGAPCPSVEYDCIDARDGGSFCIKCSVDKCGPSDPCEVGVVLIKGIPTYDCKCKQKF
jgi:RHS repeat-associated protein